MGVGWGIRIKESSGIRSGQQTQGLQDNKASTSKFGLGQGEKKLHLMRGMEEKTVSRARVSKTPGRLSGGDCGVWRIILGKVAGAGGQAVLPAWGYREERVSEFPFASAVWQDSANGGRATTHSSGCADNSSARGKAGKPILRIRSGSARYCGPGTKFPRGPEAAR